MKRHIRFFQRPGGKDGKIQQNTGKCLVKSLKEYILKMIAMIVSLKNKNKFLVT